MTDLIRRLLPVLVLSWPIAGVSLTEGAGTTALVSREFDLWPTSAAMGGAVAAASDPMVALWGNPAGVAGAPGQVGATHSEWIADTRFEQFGIILGGGRRTVVGISTHLVTTGDIPLRPLYAGVPVPQSDPLGTFEARDFALGLTGAYRLRENIDLGVSVRYMTQKVYVADAWSLAADFGLTWRPAGTWRVGLMAANIGPALDWGHGVDASLPRAFRAGASCAPLRSLSVVGDLWMQRDRDVRGTLGLEWNPASALALRAGYVAGSDSQNFSGGIGISWRGIGFDYAVVPLANDLGTAHRFALRLVPSLLRSGDRR